MKPMNEPEARQELAALCGTIKKLVGQNEYQEGELLIKKAIGKYPYAPEPHNLLGLLLEAQGDHLTAMKHFRVAWALDPAYIPARQNLDYFGSFHLNGKCAYDESDCPQEGKDNQYIAEHDSHGAGHAAGRD